MSTEAALAAIRNLLGASNFLAQPDAMAPYLTAWRNGWQGRTPFIAFPEDTGMLARLVSLCHEAKIAMVPQGGNTGLVGGAIPDLSGRQLLVNLSHMRTVRRLDRIACNITVDAGVPLQTLQVAAAEVGLLFPLSMASEGSAEVGGAIATNAGGTSVLRYGTMRALVQGLEIVTASGEIISSLAGLAKDNTGYNLSHYFIGSEGTLGFITGATLRLFPKMHNTSVGFLAVKDATAALQVLSRFRELA